MSIFAKPQVFDNDKWKDVKDEKGQYILQQQEIFFYYSLQLKNPHYVTIEDLTEKYDNRYILPATTSLSLRANNLIETPVFTNPYAQVRLIVDNISFSEEEEGPPLENEYSVSNNDIIITLNQQLLNEKQYNLDVELAFELKLTDSQWTRIGDPVTFKETYETSFIYNENDLLIEYSYPTLNQYHFLRNEYPKGYIRFSELPEGFRRRFNNKEGSFFARVTHIETDEYIEVDCTYSLDSLYFEYNMPSSFLENDAVYNISLHSRSAKGVLSNYYSYFFRTSKFNDAISKFSDYTNLFSRYQSAYSRQTLVAYPISEPFDYWESKTEKHLKSYSTGLIRMEILPDESSIFQTSSYQTLYDKLSQYPQALQWRTPEMMGIPPRFNTGYVSTTYGAAHPGYLTPELIEQGAEPIPLQSGDEWKRYYFFHHIGLIASQDYFNLRDYLEAQDEEIDLFITWFEYQNLKFNVNYVLPGLNITTSTKTFNYYD